MRPKLAKDGRKWKKRRDKWLQKSVAIVSKVKAGLPTPRDIMKAANNTQGISPSYNQAFRAIKSERAL